ncbi:hypothetical protein ACWDYJ_07000 [Streptomyces sp. NPDC003042]
MEVFTLDDDGRWGRFVQRIADPRLDEPATAAVHGGRLSVVNARSDSDRSDPATSSTIVSCSS